jgi:uncharacterized Zn finger protein (UPF0148 family)
LIYGARQQRRNKDWDSGPPAALEHALELAALRRLDPGFSQVVFEDFAFRLYSTAQRARHGADALATIAPYVTAEARGELAARAPVGEPVVQVIVGALRAFRLELPDPDAAHDPAAPPRVRVHLEYEANLATAHHTYFVVERWQLGRDAAARSKPPGVARSFPCPNCGAPWQASASGTAVCASCNQAVNSGRFDWVVERTQLVSTDERPPTLTDEVPERGTDLPTYSQPGVDAAWIALTRDDPQLTQPAFDARLAMIYAQLNAAWTARALGPARGLVTDGLYDYLQYWVDAYARQGLRNVLADMRITHTALARLTRDRYFDAITVRIWATGKDCVVRDRDGARVRGSAHRERAYSEYWTLIRTAGRKGAPVSALACSNCGAPLEVAQSGACAHCGVHLTSGECDWTLSKIEQDDSYRG